MTEGAHRLDGAGPVKPPDSLCSQGGPEFAVGLSMPRPMTRFLLLISALVFVGACATTSAEAQAKAVDHQYKADQAAASGFYGVAAEEQRKAVDEHHDAVKKAIDEGKPIPSQPQTGDKNPDGGPT